MRTELRTCREWTREEDDNNWRHTTAVSALGTWTYEQGTKKSFLRKQSQLTSSLFFFFQLYALQGKLIRWAKPYRSTCVDHRDHNGLFTAVQLLCFNVQETAVSWGCSSTTQVFMFYCTCISIKRQPSSSFIRRSDSKHHRDVLLQIRVGDKMCEFIYLFSANTCCHILRQELKISEGCRGISHFICCHVVYVETLWSPPKCALASIDWFVLLWALENV